MLHTVLEMIEKGATHLGVATDHVIESFRNRLWPGYKTAQGVERVLLAQFHPLEEALAAMGVAVWPMIELERVSRALGFAEVFELDCGPANQRLQRTAGAARWPDRDPVAITFKTEANYAARTRNHVLQAG